MDRNNFDIGLKPAEITEICRNAREVEVSLLEKLLVNLFTPLDTTLGYILDKTSKPFSECMGIMWEGKIEDYKRFVLLEERYDGLPEKGRKLLRYSPCGQAKMTAIYLRKYI